MDPSTLFSARSVAVVGASTRVRSVGHELFKNLLFSNYKGVIYPVNPKAVSILGVKCYDSVSQIPDPVDLAIILVPRNAVASVLNNCGEKGIKASVIITAGFKEIGGEGIAKEQEITAIASKYDMAVIGPNCLGILNMKSQFRLNATFARHVPNSGNIGMISQSGAMGVYALEFAAGNTIGFSLFASTGNKAVVNENDLLKVFGEDEETRVIIMYLESLHNPQEFMKVARQVTQGENSVPVLVIKSGRSKSGERAASSHTGALAERDDVLNFIFDQCGVIRLSTMEELFNLAMGFSNQPVPDGNRFAVLTNAGGPGILAADEAELRGLSVTEFSNDLQLALRNELPETASVKNPVDVVGDATPQRYESALKTLLEHSELDILLVICTPQSMTSMLDIAALVGHYAEAFRQKGIVVLCSFVAFGNEMSAIQEALQQHNVPNFDFTENAVKVAAGMVKYSEIKQREIPVFTTPFTRPTLAQNIIDQAYAEARYFLTEAESYRVIKEYNLPVAPYEVIPIQEIDSASPGFQYPVVAKVLSQDVIHKFDAGGVKVNISNQDELIKACNDIVESVKLNVPDAKLEGILVQEMVNGGVEVIIGSNYHPHYGQLLMFGLGGTFVEIFQDVSFRVAPISETEAWKMITEIRSFKMLQGYRGIAPRDIQALVNCIMELSRLVTDFPMINEVDFNPVFSLEHGVKIADARILLAKE
jgi:acetate---CoA ligase (ADP-forming)